MTVPRSPQTIAYLAGAFPSRSETFVYREVRELRSRGWRVLCATLHASTTEPEDSGDLRTDLMVVYSKATVVASCTEVIVHPLKTLTLLASALGDTLWPSEATSPRIRLALLVQASVSLGVARALRQQGVSHIHAHFAHAPATVAMYAARHLNIPFSFTGHANDLFERRALLRKKLGRAKFVACISEWHRQLYEAEEPHKKGSYQVIRCGVNTSEWRPASREEEANEGLKLVTVCRLVPKKGIDILIRALPLMTKPATLVVGGDGPELASLQALAKELQCSERITWLGAVENHVARQTIQEAHVFVLPCRTDERGDKDGIPVALMEAMACGLVVVSGDLPAIRELIEHDKTGFLLDDGKPSTLAKILDELATRDTAQMGERARGRIVEEFSLKGNVDRLERLLRSDRAE